MFTKLDLEFKVVYMLQFLFLMKILQYLFNDFYNLDIKQGTAQKARTGQLESRRFTVIHGKIYYC